MRYRKDPSADVIRIEVSSNVVYGSTYRLVIMVTGVVVAGMHCPVLVFFKSMGMAMNPHQLQMILNGLEKLWRISERRQRGPHDHGKAGHR